MEKPKYLQCWDWGRGIIVSVNRGSLYQLSCSAVGAMLYQSGRGAGLPETELFRVTLAPSLGCSGIED